jgi:hypothetical protein
MGNASRQPGGSTLQRFAQRARQAASMVEESCDFCSEPVQPRHRHLLELESRDILCACQACSLLFDRQEASLGKYRLIGERRLWLQEFQLSDVQWEELRLPVEMAFFFYSTPAGRVLAYYPSPMGPTESLLKLKSWEEMAEVNPVLQKIERDVEALLVNRTKGARHYFLVPIDDCYRLVALLRQQWRGFSGGQEVWQEIGRFFDELLARARPVDSDGAPAVVNLIRCQDETRLSQGDNWAAAHHDE